MGNTKFVPVHALLSSREKDYWATYWGSPEFLNYHEKISAMIAAIQESQAKRVFVISQDRAPFLAGFFAALYAEVPVVLPQSDAPELIRDLMQDGDVLLSDQDDLSAMAPQFISMSLKGLASNGFEPLDPRKAEVIFYTSGSSGKPKAVVKKLQQLEAEVAVLQGIWGQGPVGTFLSTVSHHHLYAFLYSLIWPVSSGFKVVRQTFTYWGDLLASSKPGDFIMSSPAHLGRFSVLEDCEPSKFGHVFSSGAPLSFEAAQTSQAYLGSLPIEVYGSTETGGVAFRQQSQESTPWKAFDCVQLSSGPNNKLCVSSPYLPENESFQTEDTVSWVDQESFHLMGRADRILKIEGKRVSLIEIENKLGQMDLIEDASVLLLQKSFRDELGAVIVLSELGKAKLDSVGKPALVRELRNGLGSYFDAVLVPRKWRFVEHIPVNAQGKRQAAVLGKLFEKNTLGPVRKPKVASQHISENKAEYELQIPSDLAYLEGHFKDMPVVPGVVQLNWAVEFAKVAFDLQGDVRQCNQIKFSNLMKPNDHVLLTLEYNPEKSSVNYTYATYSSGRVHFSQGDAGGL